MRHDQKIIKPNKMKDKLTTVDYLEVLFWFISIALIVLLLRTNTNKESTPKPQPDQTEELQIEHPELKGSTLTTVLNSGQ